MELTPNRLPVGPHEQIVADAGYCSVAGVEYVHHRGADVLVRINPQSFVAFSAKGARVALSARLQGLSRAGRTGQWPVVLHGPRSSFSGRVCAVRKSELAIQLAHRRLHRRSSKKQIRTRPETLEFAKYVVVFTTRSIGSAEEILQLYPMRWQIELAFKRMKSLARLGHLQFLRLALRQVVRRPACSKNNSCRSRYFPFGDNDFAVSNRPVIWREFRFALH